MVRFSKDVDGTSEANTTFFRVRYRRRDGFEESKANFFCFNNDLIWVDLIGFVSSANMLGEILNLVIRGDGLNFEDENAARGEF